MTVYEKKQLFWYFITRNTLLCGLKLLFIIIISAKSCHFKTNKNLNNIIFTILLHEQYMNNSD